MNEFWNNNKRAILFGIIVVLVLAGIALGVVFYYGSFENAKLEILGGGERTIVEVPTPRAIENISRTEGRTVSPSGEAVPLVGKEHIIVEGGKKLKESYTLTAPEAVIWAPDAKLVYIKSLGTVALDGTSSGWEIAFGSKVQKKGYIFSVTGGSIIEKKEVTSVSFGYALPSDWYDGDEAIKSIITLPQFKDATISGLSFYYNEDGKRWGYAISSSNGTVSIPVR